MTSFSFLSYRRTVGRDDWIDLFAMLTAPLRRRSGFKPFTAMLTAPLRRRSGFKPFTGILPSASPPSRTAPALVRINAFGIFKTKKTAVKGGFLF